MNYVYQYCIYEVPDLTWKYLSTIMYRKFGITLSLIYLIQYRRKTTPNPYLRYLSNPKPKQFSLS